ncbi:MAG TPA: endonuclease III [Vicinamibacteria bacterium]
MPATASMAVRLGRIADRLARVYGRPRRRRGDPLDVLVETVLSQNTSDLNSGRAFRSLKAAFPSWQAVAAARAGAVESAIRVGGLARIKSRRIQALLGALQVREGGYHLRGLQRQEAAAAAARLAGLPGVGPKTRACVQLFACGQAAFPVDTHVHRITRRLGLVDARADAVRTQALLEPDVPAGRALDLHLNLIRLGREVCRPRDPRCPECALRPLCAFARRAA